MALSDFVGLSAAQLDALVSADETVTVTTVKQKIGESVPFVVNVPSDRGAAGIAITTAHPRISGYRTLSELISAGLITSAEARNFGKILLICFADARKGDGK